MVKLLDIISPPLSASRRVPLSAAIHRLPGARDWRDLRATIRENERKEISAPERYHGRRRIFEDMLKAEVLCRLRSGAWIGEGYSEGIVEPKRPATAWWQCDVNLNLFDETVEWNGVRLSGLGIYPGNLPSSPGE